VRATRVALLVVLVVSVAAPGCAGRPRNPAPALAVRVSTLRVDFPTRERGSLEFVLELPPDAPPPRAVSWELFLEGVRFAAGVEAQLAPQGGRLTVKTPLLSKHFAWREGATTLDVGVKGEVDVGRAGEPLGFRERREVKVQGRPLWTAPE
jgi:hypothetical protein